jgi:hypothetical protein
MRDGGDEDDALSDAERAIYDAGRGDGAGGEQPPAPQPEGPAPEDQEAPAGEPERGEEREERDEREDRKVPSWRLREQTKKAQEAERKAEEADRRYNDLMARISAAQERAAREEAEAAAKPAPPPDIETQPFEAVKYERQRREELERRMEERETTREQQEQAAAAQRDYLASLATREAEFQKQNPDYYDRATHVLNATTAAIKERHPQASDAAARAEATRLLHAQAWELEAAGIDPALYWHTLAAQRLGYKPKAAAAPAAPRDQQGKFRSLSDSPGAAPRGELTAEQIADMDEDKLVALSRSKKIDLAKVLAPKGR